MKKIDTPELDKMVEVRDESQTISSFQAILDNIRRQNDKEIS